jgi:flagellar biosynthesis chaperone FliJ
MQKELVICVILVILIIIGDIVTQNYTKNTVNYITGELKSLKQSLFEKDDDKADEEISKIDNKWKEVYDKLAYYIEHDELEKVESNFTACKSLAKTREYEQSISELEKTVYVLEHITDKYSFNLVNIF